MSNLQIFAERIMVQMENQLTKEDISFRIMSHNITKIEVSIASLSLLGQGSQTRGPQDDNFWLAS